jgi:hypothetical protein
VTLNDQQRAPRRAVAAPLFLKRDCRRYATARNGLCGSRTRRGSHQMFPSLAQLG